MVNVDPPVTWGASPDAPPVVVAIAHWNRLELVRACIDSILQLTTYPHYRICVFDQGSTDGSLAYLRGLEPRIDVISSAANVGFIDAINEIACRYARWDVVILNNDTRVTDGWLDALVSTATAAANIGLVGAKLVYPDGRLQEAGSQIFADGTARARGRHAAAADPAYQERREVDYCSGACLYVRRAVLDRCGLFERCYSHGYYEDVDLAFKARHAGFKVLYEPACTIVHHEHGTFGKDAARKLMEANRAEFRARWASDLVRYARNRWTVPRDGRDQLLIVSRHVPANSLCPLSRRARQIIRELSVSYQVVFVNLMNDVMERYEAMLEELGVASFYPECGKAVGDPDLDLDAIMRSNRFVAVVFVEPSVVASLGPLVRRLLPDGVLISDVGMHENGISTVSTAVCNRVIVESAAQESEVTALGRVRCSILPYVAEAFAGRPSNDVRFDLLFWSDGPDRASVDLVQTIVSMLKDVADGVRFRLVGGSGASEILAVGHERFDVVPLASPARPVLDRARVVVVPQFSSSQRTRSNIEEARARGVPIVTSQAVIHASGLEDGTDALAADSVDAFASQTLRLIRERRFLERLTQMTVRRYGSRTHGAALQDAVDLWVRDQRAHLAQRT